MLEISQCPACGRSATESTKVGTFGKISRQGEEMLPNRLVELSRCVCTHLYNNPQHEWDDLTPFYSKTYHVFRIPPMTSAAVDAEIQNHEGGKFRQISIIPGGRFLDVGCGNGDVVALMGALGMRAQGVEVSPVASETARSLGRDVICGTLEQAGFPEKTFDSMSINHVLEHVHEPVKLLSECRELLKDDGDLLVAVPNSDSLMHQHLGDAWVHLDLPRHLHHFTSASLEATANRAGLEKVAQATSPADLRSIEYELVEWCGRKLYLHHRIRNVMRKTGFPLRPMARRIAAQTDATSRGEILFMNFRRKSQ